MDGERLPTCAFFNDRMANMPSTARLFKQSYCRGDFGTYARFMVFKALGREKVPIDLFPNQQDRARTLVTKH